MPHTPESRQKALEVLRRRRKEWLRQNGPCACGSWDRLEVHHRDPTQKVTHKVWSWADLPRQIELSKCEPKCHDCHRKISAIYLREKYTIPWDQVVHGRSNTYLKYGCRCDPCREDYKRWRREKYLRVGN